MKITLAKTAGFCFGVNRAVQMVYDLLNEGKKVCTLGPIIHNPQLVSELENRGVRKVSDINEVTADEILVIRSHGVEQCVYDALAQKGIKIADATCPFVAKIHSIVKKAGEEGKAVIIAGDETHQEVIGIKGHCEGEAYVVSDVQKLLELLKNKPELVEKPVIMVSQTTFNAEIWVECQKNLKKVCTNAEVFDTICNATSMRQKEAAELSAQNDAMVVIGGRHSSNTSKLFDVCSSNCGKTCLVETVEELEFGFFDGFPSAYKH